MKILNEYPSEVCFYGHRVVTEMSPRLGASRVWRDNCVTTDQIDRLIGELLFNGYSPVDVHALSRTLNENDGSKKFSLTFDDGYRDNLTNLLPILEKHNVPATIFVTSGFVAREVFPLELALESALPQSSRLMSVRRFAKLTWPALRTAVTRRFAKNQDDLFLNWDELEILSRHPLVTIGSHTVSHPALPYLPNAIAARELRGSRRVLEERLGVQITTVAYPYGSYSPRIGELAVEAGYRIGFITDTIYQQSPDSLAIQRIDLNKSVCGI